MNSQAFSDFSYSNSSNEDDKEGEEKQDTLSFVFLFVQKITYLDLHYTPIYEQFDTGDIAAVIRREE